MSIFYDEWRDCLREHYIYVIQSNDHVTEPSLREVMLEIGFTEDDLEHIRAEVLQQH